MSSLLPIYPPRPLAPSELNGQLSPAEADFADEANVRPIRSRGLPVAEIDAELRIDGTPVAVTLAVWGTFTKAMKGGHEPGERPYEPDEEAGFEVDTIMLGESDVTGDLGEAGEKAVAAYVMENVEPEPYRDACEDRR